MSLFVYYRLIVQNSFCQTFAICDLGQPLHPAGQVTFTCHLPRDKVCKKYLSDPDTVGKSVHKTITLWCKLWPQKQRHSRYIQNLYSVYIVLNGVSGIYFIQHCHNVLGECILCKPNNYYCQWLEIAICLRKMIYQASLTLTSESCTGNLNHCDSVIEGYQTSTVCLRAFLLNHSGHKIILIE